MLTNTHELCGFPQESTKSDLSQFISPFLNLSFFIFKMRSLGDNSPSGFVQL